MDAGDDSGSRLQLRIVDPRLGDLDGADPVWIPSPSFADFEPIYLGNIDLVDPDRRTTADDDDDDADEDEHGDEPEQDNDNTNGTVAAPETCSSRVIAPSPVVTSGLQNAMMGTEVRSRLHLEEKKEEEQEEPLAISPRA
eukprot:COSAG01_NODE_23632_length_807_cov_1933.049435_1_plen_139_part_10